MTAFKQTTRGLFSGIKEAQGFKGPRPLTTGQYVVKVDTIRTFRSRRDSKQVFTAELEIMESSNPEFKTGDVVGWVAKEGPFICYFLADVKSFLAAAGDVGEDEVDEEAAELAVSDEQPLRGNKMRVIVEPNPKNEKYFVSRFLAEK